MKYYCRFCGMPFNDPAAYSRHLDRCPHYRKWLVRHGIAPRHA